MKKIMILLFSLVILIPFAFADESNLGTVEWKNQIVSPNSFVDIIVKDDDMNKKEYIFRINESWGSARITLNLN